MKKRIVAVLLLLAVFVAMIPTAFAADETAQSVVLRDLKSMTFDGEPWNIEDYPVDTSDVGCYCIALDEVGFRKDGNLNNYAFYLYVYNPSGREIVSTSPSNRVQMAVAWDKDGQPTEYEKFRMTLISVSSEAGLENVFYKFRVEDRASDYDGTTMKSRLLKTKSRREYDITGFELLMKQTNEIKDHAVGCNVIVRGYDVGCGDGNTESTKAINYIGQQTLTLDVQQAYWRTQSSSKGVNHKHQINSAYFSVPNEVWEQYKELYSIKCVWEEHHTTPMIVTDDRGLYDTLMKARSSPFVSYNANFPTLATKYILDFNQFTGVRRHIADYAWNINDATGPYWDEPQIQRRLLSLDWIFFADEEIKLNTESVSSTEVLDYYEKYCNASNGPAVGITGGTYMLLNTVDEGREEFRNGMTIYFDELTEGAFDLSNYDSNHGWLQKVIDYNIFNGGFTIKGYTVDTNEVYPDFVPIDIIEYGSEESAYLCALGSDLEYIAEKYFLNDVDQADEFRDYVRKAVAKKETVVLFRYASTDYYSESLTVIPEIEGHAYIATQTFFKDFDVIQLQFKGEDMSIATVPVVNDPEDVVGGIDSSTTSTDSDLVKGQNEKEWEEILEALKKILKWLVIILVVSALIPLIFMAVNMLLDLFTGGSSGSGRRNYKRRRRK